MIYRRAKTGNDERDCGYGKEVGMKGFKRWILQNLRVNRHYVRGVNRQLDGDECFQRRQ